MEVIQWLRNFRDSEEALVWNGNFSEYLQMVVENPNLAMHAHARIYEMIHKAGIKDLNNQKSYAFFNKELFGMEKP